MSNNRIDITLEADASGAIRVIKQVSTSVDQLAGKKVGNAGMPELASGAQRASQSLKQTKSDTDALTNSLSKVRNMIAGAFAVKSIVDFGKKVLGASANMEVFKKGLSFTLGSEGEADHLIASMQQIGEESAYDTTQLLPLARQWVNIGNTSDEAISKMKKIVDLGSAYGMQTEQIQAANLALTQMSMAGKIGAQDMMQLINAGVPAWQLLADKMGLSVAEVRDLSQKGALGEEAIESLWDAITEKTQGAADTMGNTLMAKFSNMQESVTNSMAGIGDIISQGFDLKDVLTDMGAQTEAFKQHINNIKEAAKQVGVQQAIVDELAKISPEASRAADGVMNAFSGIKKTITENKDAIKLVTEAVVIFGGTIAVINGIQTGFAALKGAILAVNAAVMANPMVIIAAVIITALALIYTHWDEIKAVVTSVTSVISAKCSEIGSAITGKIGEAIAWISGLWESVKTTASTYFNAIVDAVTGFMSAIMDTANSYIASIEESWAAFSAAVMGVVQVVVDWFLSSVWTPIRDAAVTAINFIVGSWAAFGMAIMAVVQPIADWFQSSVWGPICEYAAAAWNSITAQWSQFVSWFTQIMSQIADAASERWNSICEFASEAWGVVTEVWGEFVGWFTQIMSQVADAASDKWNSICEFANEAWNTISDLWNQFASWFSEIMGQVSDFASECWNAVCDFASEAWDTISGVWGAVAGWFDSTVVQPIRSAFNNGTSYISQCFQNAYSEITGLFSKLAGWFDSNVVQPIKEKFSKILSLGSSVTGMTVTASGGGDAPAAAQGGVFGRFASGGVVGGRIPALANGGQSNRGTMALIGEAGPETVLPLKKIILAKVGQAIAEASGMDANKKNPVYNTRKSFSDTTKPKDVDAYTKILDETKQKILKINEAQAKFHEEWQKAQEDASKYTEGGEKALAFQEQMASNQEKIAKLQEKISSGNGDAKDAEALKILQLQTQNRIAEYEKEKAAAIAAAQETQDAITNIDAEAEAARQKVKQQAIDQIGSYETQLAQAQYAQKKAMMATELDDFLAQMTAKDEITGQSYATTLANEQYLAEQRRVWMDELMLASVSWGEYMQTMLTNMAVQVQDGIASGIAQCVVEGKKFSQVMSNLAKTLLKQLIQGVIQKVISGWIMAIGLGNNRHKQEMKNTAAETEAAAAKATVMASVATAAVIAANPHMAAGAAALVSGQMGEAAAAAGLISKAAQKVFQDKDSDSGGDKDKKKDNLVINIGADPDSLTKAWNLPHFAKGGVVTGPTAALIGEGRYDEAVLPLKPSLLERLFGGGDDNRQNTVVATQNIYGDINYRDDEDDLFSGFNDMVLAGLRGA